MNNMLVKGGLDESVFQDGSSPRSIENRKNLSQALLGEKKESTSRILEFRAKPAPAPEGILRPPFRLFLLL